MSGCLALQINLSGEKVLSGNICLLGAVSLSNVNLLCKRVPSILFSELLLCLQFFKIILMPEQYILAWHVLLCSDVSHIPGPTNWVEVAYPLSVMTTKGSLHTWINVFWGKIAPG